MKYLKVFQIHDDYLDFTETPDYILPNVSYCIQEDEVHYNPIIQEAKIIATFYYNDNLAAKNGNDKKSEGTKASIDPGPQPPPGEQIINCGALDHFYEGIENVCSSIKVDGEEISLSTLEENSGYLVLDQTTEHTIEFTIIDSTKVPNGMFIGCYYNSIVLPNTITEIGEFAFDGCEALSTINLPNSLTTIGEGAFSYCFNLTLSSLPSSVTTIGNNAFCDCSNIYDTSIENQILAINSDGMCEEVK